MITLTIGHIQNYSGTAVPNGSISFQLNTNASVVAPPGGLIPASQIVIFQFDQDGNIQANARIYSNAELNPQNASGLGTFYLVTIYDANGAPLNSTPMFWQFTEAANATVDISTMTAYFTGGTVIYYPSAGTVTSVGLTDDTGLFIVANSPITTSGNIILSFANENANTVLAGPASGSPVAPTFRALVPADLPALVSAIQYVIDGGGSTPATGAWGQIQIPYNCTITSVTLTADQSGSAVVDLLTSSYSGFPGSLTSITASDQPTLSSAQKSTDSTLTGWTTTLTAGTILQFYLDSVTTCTRLNLTVKLAVVQ